MSSAPSSSRTLLARAGVDAGRSRRSHPRPGADRRPGPEPGPPGVDQRRPAQGDHRLGPQPGLRLGPARHRARHAADRHGRRQGHHRRRPGIDVAVAACRSICAPACKMGDYKMIDTMIKDGLWDAFNGYHMGNTAENVARQFQITRDDAGPVRASPRRTRPRPRRRPASSRTRSSPSPSRAARATPSSTRTNTSATAPRIDAMHKLRPAFDKDGTVTAANASGINDGAAGVAADDRGRSRAARHHPAGAHRLLGDRRRRSGDHGHRPDPRLAQGAGEGRLEGRRPRPRRGQRGLRRAGLRRQQGHGLESRRSSTSMAAPSPSAIRSARPARASSTRWSTR